MVSDVGFHKVIQNKIRNSFLVERPGVVIKFEPYDSILPMPINSGSVKQWSCFYHLLETIEFWISTSRIPPHF